MSSSSSSSGMRRRRGQRRREGRRGGSIRNGREVPIRRDSLGSCWPCCGQRAGQGRLLLHLLLSRRLVGGGKRRRRAAANCARLLQGRGSRLQQWHLLPRILTNRVGG